MNIRVFVLLTNVFTLFGYESRTDWMKQYFDKCDKLSELYQELIDVMESPKEQPQLDYGETVRGSKNPGNDITSSVNCNHHQIGLNSTGIENGMARLEQLMTMMYSGISDEKNARVKNTQSVMRIEATAENNRDFLTAMINTHLNNLSSEVGNIVRFETNVQGDYKALKNDTEMMHTYFIDLFDKVENINRLEANVEDEIDVLKNETALVSKRLADLSHKLFELDRKNKQTNDKIEQNMDILSDKLDKIYTAIMSKNDINFALYKPATESSTYSRNAGAATDGDKNGHWGGASCTHTLTETKPWWRVDLLGQYFISRVLIHNRLDCCGDRLHDLTVTVSNTTDGEETVCGYYKGPSTNGANETIWCVPPLIGRFLKIQISAENAAVLTLCEVEVF